MTGGNSSWSVFRRKETFQNKEIHNGCVKMQNNFVAGCIKGFLIICKPKTKEIKFVTMSLP